jgi:hypothetical protein
MVGDAREPLLNPFAFNTGQREPDVFELGQRVGRKSYAAWAAQKNN